MEVKIFRKVLLILIVFVKIVTMEIQVQIVTILPSDDKMFFSINRISPAIEMAIDQLHNNNEKYFKSRYVNFTVKYADSKCDSAAGMNEAIKFHIKVPVHLFLGPVCDYSVAPVARQVKFWNVPIVSGGAMALDFVTSRQSEYPLLTRVGPVSFSSLSTFLVKLLSYLKWKKLKILYEKNGHADMFEDFCHLVVSGIHYGVADWITQDYFKIDDDTDLGQTLTNEIGYFYGAVNIPASPAYGVYDSQLIRYARASQEYRNFLQRGKLLTNKLLTHKYCKQRLIKRIEKFYGCHQKFVDKLGVSVSRMILDFFDTQ